MYLVTRFDTIKYEGNDLITFIYNNFELKIEKGRIFIRPNDYSNYINKDFYEHTITYSEEYTKEEIINHFLNNGLVNYFKAYDYKIYKAEQL